VPRVASAYEYKEAFDRVSDVADHMRREPEIWPEPVAADDDAEPTGWRGKPFTEAEIEDYYARGGAVTICPTPAQKAPDVPWTELQTWVKREFHPAPFAVETCLDHLKSIKARSRRDMHIADRARAIIKAVLSGLPFNAAAAELSLDPGLLSKTLRKVYKRYPKLKPSLTLLRSLNLQAKRREQTIFWAVSPMGERPNIASPVFEELVAVEELRHKAFPVPQSNYSFMVEHVITMNPGGEWEALQAPISAGTWRRSTTGYDAYDQELDTFDSRAEIIYVDDRLDALYAWQRLRRLIDLFTGPARAIAGLFCFLEALPADEVPQSLSRPPLPAEARLVRITTPAYRPHVNECPDPDKIGGPNKYQRAKALHERKPTLQQRFATSVFNKGDPTADQRYQRMFPEPPGVGGKVIVRGRRHIQVPTTPVWHRPIVEQMFARAWRKPNVDEIYAPELVTYSCKYSNHCRLMPNFNEEFRHKTKKISTPSNH
jgi:hypothetical protein